MTVDAELDEKRVARRVFQVCALDDVTEARHMADLVERNRSLGRRTCRICGCWELAACEGGCWWVEDDLCSACEPTE